MSSSACLHLLCGKAGAGKSTLATALAAEHKAILIAEDVWLIRLYGPMKTFDDYRTYSQRAKTVVGPLVVDLLRLGQSVVLDCPANTKSSRLWLRSLFESAGARHVLHHLATPDEVCLQRIEWRNKERPEGSYHLTKADFDHVSGFFEAPEAGEGFNVEIHGLVNR
jgi:predicted kinase